MLQADALQLFGYSFTGFFIKRTKPNKSAKHVDYRQNISVSHTM